ncbi:early endosome antigen 1-like [Formica exsecta]|uniref:early endosome antigen 1-like n=1 Tax=Formica exsecta TaxID=72781 RepID=UPI0011426E75|nr:early endosome antigen 1-like [Formica exsecta]
MDDDTKTSNIQEISQLERQFGEKLYELQNNTDTLRVMQKELLETHHALYNTESELEKERRVSHELKMQLKAAMNAVNELQQQQTKNQVESVQLQVKYNAMAKQYDSLMNQATTAKVHETECKIKIQSLEENLRQKEMSNKRLEQTLNELEHDNLRTITAIDQKITKLSQEHQNLQKSCEAIIGLNQRLQILDMCTHAIHKKNEAKIKDLEYMLASMSVRNVEFTEKLVKYNVCPEK